MKCADIYVRAHLYIGNVRSRNWEREWESFIKTCYICCAICVCVRVCRCVVCVSASESVHEYECWHRWLLPSECKRLVRLYLGTTKPIWKVSSHVCVCVFCFSSFVRSFDHSRVPRYSNHLKCSCMCIRISKWAWYHSHFLTLLHSILFGLRALPAAPTSIQSRFFSSILS